MKEDSNKLMKQRLIHTHEKQVAKWQVEILSN